MKLAFRPRHLLLGAMLLGSAIALSSTPDAQRVDVHYQDLDISQPEDAKVLYRRIRQAARHVCNDPGFADLARRTRFQQCYESAVSNAVDSVNEQTLTALHHASLQKARAS